MTVVLMLVSLIFPLAAALLLFFLRRRRLVSRLSMILGAIEVSALLALCVSDHLSGPVRLGQYWRIDPLSGFFLANIAVIFALVLAYSRSYTEHPHHPPGNPEDAPSAELSHAGEDWTSPGLFFALVFLFVFTMVGVCLASNLGLMWIMMEATTLSSALLVGFEQTEGAIEAGWKYLILCTVGIAFALFGTIVFYLAAVKAGMPPLVALDWDYLHQSVALLSASGPLLRLAFVFLLVGFGTKVGLVPLHSWLPDAHAEAPAPISALLSAILLSCALYCVLRYEALLTPAAGAFAHHLLLLFGGASMLLAALLSVVQQDLKRLFAYSSIEHMGLVAIGVGIGTPLALYGALLHLLNHGLAKSMLFCSAGEVRRDCGTLRMEKIRGLMRSQPWTAGALLVGGAAIVGLPPLGLFVSEFAILAAAFASAHYLVGCIVMLALAVIFAAFLRHFLPLLGGPPAEDAAPPVYRRLPAAVFAIATLLLLGLGLHVPVFLRQMIENAIRTLHG